MNVSYHTLPPRRNPIGQRVRMPRFIYPPESAADGNPADAVRDGRVDSIRWVKTFETRLSKINRLQIQPQKLG